jgi:mutator protein MutT
VTGPEPTLLGVIGVLRDGSGRVLLVQRSERVTHPGLWCFPGGHVEPDETLEDAVARELREELEIEVRAERHLGFVRVPSSHYRLEVFTVSWLSGDVHPNPAEVADARFLTLDEIRELAAPMASNLRVVEMLEA